MASSPSFKARCSYQSARFRTALRGSLSVANSWAWLVGSVAIWVLLRVLGYVTFEPVGQLGGVFTGAVSLIASWILVLFWRFVVSAPFEMHREAECSAREDEKSAERQDPRIALIAKGRALVANVVRELLPGESGDDVFRKELESSAFYYELRKLLSDEYLGVLSQHATGRYLLVPSPRSNIPALALRFLGELDRLERQLGTL